MVHFVRVDGFISDLARVFVLMWMFSWFILLECMFSWLTWLECLFSFGCSHGSFC